MFLTFSDIYTYAYFFANQSYIAGNLCINKEKPISKCNGKCQLSKALNDKSDADNQLPIRSEEERTITVYITIDNSLEILNIVATDKQKNLSNYEWFYSYRYVSSIFHPPQV